MPETPEEPETPETPEMPEIPGDPETPEISETPETPETPEAPEAPVVTQTVPTASASSGSAPGVLRATARSMAALTSPSSPGDPADPATLLGAPASSSGTVTLGDTVVDASATLPEGVVCGSDGSLSLTNYNGADVTLDCLDCGVTILSAGVNRIGTILSDGDVNVIGTGIILVDSITLYGEADTVNFNLLSNTSVYAEDSGSVAVFLKTGENEYTLINNGVVGILDETYVVPEGITLIVPDGETLQIEGLYRIEAIGSYIYSGPQYSTDWTIGVHTTYKPTHASLSVSTLIAETGSYIRMFSRETETDHSTASALVLTGSGSVIDHLWMDAGCGLAMGSNCTVNTLVANGNGIELVIKDDDVINTLTASDPAATNMVAVFSGTHLSNGGSSLTIGTIKNGVTVSAKAGTITANGSGSQISTEHVGSYHSGATIIDNAPSGGITAGSAPLVLLPGSAERAGLSGSTPVTVDYSFYTEKDKLVGLSALPGKFFPADAKPTYLTQLEFKSSGQVSIKAADVNYESLKALFTPELEGIISGSMDSVVYQLVMKTPDGTVYTEILHPGHTTPDNSEDLCCIRVIHAGIDYNEGMSGLAVTSATTSATGTGILGGTGSGSTGGAFILRSSGASRHGTTPADPGTTDPDPGTTDPDPGTTDDPVIPAPPDTPAKPSGTSDGTEGGNKETNPAALRTTVTALEEKDPQTYKLRVFNAAGREIAVPRGTSVRASFRFKLPADWKAGNIFAVFRLPDGSLKAVRARYDAATGTLSFVTDTASEFTLVNFEYRGTLYTSQFYAALETYLKTLG